MAAGEDMEVDSPAVDIVDVEKDAKRFEKLFKLSYIKL